MYSTRTHTRTHARTQVAIVSHLLQARLTKAGKQVTAPEAR